MSPHNVFVTYAGQAKVLDFGIAKLDSSEAQTATGVVKGKLRYMPPEQLADGSVDRRADIFSVGVMLWEAVTCRKMWTGQNELGVMRALADGKIPNARDFLPDLDAQMGKILDRALAPDPELRFSTALEFERSLDSYLAQRGLTVRPHDVERNLTALFKNDREETAHLIETQMARVTALSPDALLKFTPPDLGHGGTAAGFTASRINRFRLPSNGEGTRLAISGLAILSTLLALALVLRSGAGEKAASPVRAKAKESESVKLHVTAFPASARIFLDDGPLVSNPMSLNLHRDPASLLTLRAEAEGHISEVRTVYASRDQDLVLTLRQNSPAPQSPELTPATKQVKPPKNQVAKANNGATPSNCEPPYAVDARGVKRFKPECL